MSDKAPGPPEVHHVHFILHGIHFIVVLFVCVCLDICILDYRHDRPRHVRWNSGEEQTNFKLKHMYFPSSTNKVELGILDDGTFVWRPVSK